VGLDADFRDMGVGFRLAMTPGSFLAAHQVHRHLSAAPPPVE
jgi:hypothetical protein